MPTSRPIRRAAAVTGTALLMLTLGGCIVVPANRYYGPPAVAAGPAPQVEYPGPPPVVGYIWIGGFWRWFGGRQVWEPGRWDAPRRGYGR